MTFRLFWDARRLLFSQRIIVLLSMIGKRRFKLKNLEKTQKSIGKIYPRFIYFSF